MVKVIDLKGMRFGRLTVTARAESSRAGKARWHCICDCGGCTIAVGSGLINGTSTSCGCYRDERNIESKTKHGMADSRLYRIWGAMKKRCNNPNNTDYKYYGGRGITYHPSFETFEGFLAGIPDGYTDSMEIDRIKSDGNYEPGNLRWATRSGQMRNTRRTLVNVKGSDELVNYAELGERFGLKRATIWQRIARGESIETALRPAKTPAKRLDDDLVKQIKSDLWSMSRDDVAAWHNVPVSTVNDIYYQSSYRHIKID